MEAPVISKETWIFILHGLRGIALTQWPMEWFLKSYGYTNIRRLRYRCGGQYSLQDSLEDASWQIKEIVGEDTPVVVIGISMGGLVALRLHAVGINVVHSISIASPLNGARILKKLEPVVPGFIGYLLYQKAYDELKEKEPEKPPPHSYSTMGMEGWRWRFDGRVFCDETQIEEEHHTNFRFVWHGDAVFHPLVWINILIDLEKYSMVRSPVLGTKESERIKAT